MLPIKLTETFTQFVDSEKSSALLLLGCTIFSLIVANSAMGGAYANFWHLPIAGMGLQHWINDGLMAVFFLLIGLELEREIYSGELSSLRNALLPIFAALGGMLVPAAIHFAFNMGTPTQAGVGIPMATDIAFALGVLAILGSRVPLSLKVFVVAFAVIDDLGAIIVIATLYTAKVSTLYLAAAATVWVLMFIANRWLRWMHMAPYLVGGALLWWLMLKSGVHATLAGVLLAFAIPYSARSDDETSPSHRLEHYLHKPVAFLVLPLFALANTGVVIGSDWTAGLAQDNSLGILAGLVLGKPLGVVAFCWLAIVTGVASLPDGLRWSHLAGAGMLGGIGFTMAIFIGSLAFAGDPVSIDASKLAVFVASLMAGAIGYAWLRWVAPPSP
ncbi:MAG: Na+/H+ antiporter NhaA [Gammaproteobacteria bacterium RIFCSPHIGHO2_12_FULL_63_22]|nr:MAG: Na+/H+ antiporter NhaA [Gammaproteobacteria bacterium RIFCSPHIGHO2_12_FULL_63_22]